MDLVATIDKLVSLLRKANFTDEEIFDFCTKEPTFEKFLELYEGHPGIK